MTEAAPCPGCGLVRGPDDGPTHASMASSPGCWALFTEVMAREYSDPGRWPIHALTVDAYGAQHPGAPSSKAARSVGAHLIGLGLVLERGLSPERGARIRTTVLDRLGEGLTWLQPPVAVGGLTIAHVWEAGDVDDHRRRVREWAEDVWRAWGPHHDTVRRRLDWLAAASPPGFLDGAPGT